MFTATLVLATTATTTALAATSWMGSTATTCSAGAMPISTPTPASVLATSAIGTWTACGAAPVTTASFAATRRPRGGGGTTSGTRPRKTASRTTAGPAPTL